FPGFPLPLKGNAVVVAEDLARRIDLQRLDAHPLYRSKVSLLEDRLDLLRLGKDELPLRPRQELRLNDQGPEVPLFGLPPVLRGKEAVSLVDDGARKDWPKDSPPVGEALEDALQPPNPLFEVSFANFPPPPLL